MQLIKIHQNTINKESVNTVNARELHAFLESKQDFSNWIRNRIKKYGFSENQDYLINKIIEQLPNGSKYKNEYFLSIDMSKELCMVERNEKGKQARQYFITCEKQLKEASPKQFIIPQTLSQALQLAADQAKVIEEQAPKVEYFEKFMDSDHVFTVTEAAKKLGIQRKRLIEFLEDKKILFRRKGNLEAYATAVNNGLFVMKAGTSDQGYAYIHPYITTDGMNWVNQNYIRNLMAN